MIARDSRKLANSILYSEVVAYRKFLAEVESVNFGIYGEILNACQSAQEVHECCAAIVNK